MPPLLLLTGALVLNWLRHRRDKSTICSTLRPYIGPTAFIAGWITLTVWFIPHYCNRDKFPPKRGRR